jgi:uncharacterized protein
MNNKKFMSLIPTIILIIGGLNWGLIGLFNFNLVSKIFGSISWLESFIYIIVGISAIYKLIQISK